MDSEKKDKKKVKIDLKKLRVNVSETYDKVQSNVPVYICVCVAAFLIVVMAAVATFFATRKCYSFEFDGKMVKVSTAGSIRVHIMPDSVLWNTFITSLGQPCAILDVQHPYSGSSPNILARPLFVVKKEPSSGMMHATWFIC